MRGSYIKTACLLTNPSHARDTAASAKPHHTASYLRALEHRWLATQGCAGRANGLASHTLPQLHHATDRSVLCCVRARVSSLTRCMYSVHWPCRCRRLRDPPGHCPHAERRRGAPVLACSTDECDGRAGRQHSEPLLWCAIGGASSASLPRREVAFSNEPERRGRLYIYIYGGVIYCARFIYFKYLRGVLMGGRSAGRCRGRQDSPGAPHAHGGPFLLEVLLCRRCACPGPVDERLARPCAAA